MLLTTLLKNFRQNNLAPTFQNRLIQLNFLAAGFFLISSVAVLLIFRQSLPPQVPLFYSLVWGKDQLAPSFWLWLLPTGELVVLIINFFLAAVFYPKEKTLSYFTAFAMTSFNLLILITQLKIIYLVTG